VEGTGFAGAGRTSVVRIPANGSLAQRAYALAVTFDGGRYIRGAVGTLYDGVHRAFDCSGLICWCYAQCGYSWGDRVQANADGSIRWFQNAADQYVWLADQHGGRAISVDQAQPGDLLFCGPPGNPAAIEHVAFCSKAGGFVSGENFGANNPDDGIGPFAINGYHDGPGEPFNFAIDTSGITTSEA
jgi:hypothetical protein